MKTNILPAIKLTAICILFFMGVYPVVMWGMAQLAPNHGRGEVVKMDGKIVGYKNIGQKFTDKKYFWPRPSAVAYNASSSGGSNKGPSNPDYLKSVQANIDTFLMFHPYLTKAQVPAEMVTASGSGLDPDISPAAAEVQVKRVAETRKMAIDKVEGLLKENTCGPLLGLFGPSKVNVLELNVALDNISK